MTRKAGLTSVLMALVLTSTSCASARSPPGAARFPRELHGVWEGGVVSCGKPGNTDSDARIVIAERELAGYEDSQDLLEIEQVSSAPLAWKVRTRLNVYEESSEITEIFVLSGEDKGQLTIVDESQSTRYERCL